MFGLLGRNTDVIETPIDKVQTALKTVVYGEIMKRRNSTLRDNIIHTPTFIGIAPQLAQIDPEDESTEIGNTLSAEVRYAVTEDPEEDTTIQQMVMLDKKWVEHLSHPQLVDLIHEVMSNKLTVEKEDEIKVVNDDWTDYEYLKYRIIETPSTEVTATLEESEKSGESCSTGEALDDLIDSEGNPPGTKPEEKELEAKSTEDTVATFTKMKEDMSGKIEDFIGYEPEKITDKDIQDIQSVQDILQDGMKFSGRGKAKTVNPSKRLNMKAIITESSENEYIGKKVGAGKKVKIMITIDRSGSMSGQPTRESNVLVSALNNIVLENSELEITVMLSYTGSYTVFKLPLEDKFSQDIWNLTKTGNAEYLWQNMKKNIDLLQNADINLVYTDGSICDDPIDKIFMDRRDIVLNGLYTSDKMDIDNIKAHYSRNKMYFHHVIVRPSVQELAEEISNKIFQERQSR